MSGAPVTLRQDAGTAPQLRAHLAACDAQFHPPLSRRVELDGYAAKLRARARTFEAWAGDELVGLVAAYLDPAAGAGFVSSVSVDPRFARQGVARRLLAACLAAARERGLAELALEVSAESEGAIRLYQGLGFHEVSRRDGTLRMAAPVAGPGSAGARPDHRDEGGARVRDHNQEHQDRADRKYAYDFDGVVRRYLLRALAPHLRRPGSALELGCYRGDMTEQLLGLFDRLTVVEAASELAAHVAGRFPGRVEVVTATFEAVELEPRFDNVFLVHTLEHLDDPVGTLARIRGWLAPGGRLFVAVPNAYALSRQLAVHMGLVAHATAVTPAEAAHGHRRTYSADLLLYQLGQAGLVVQDQGGVLLKPLANFQFDRALAAGIVDEPYLEACQALARTYPDLSASLYAVCAAPAPGAPRHG